MGQFMMENDEDLASVLVLPEEGEVVSELDFLRDHVAHLQTALAVLVKRAGGRLFMPEEELQAIVGHGVSLTHEDEGIVILTTTPEGVQEDLEFLVTHNVPFNIQ